MPANFQHKNILITKFNQKIQLKLHPQKGGDNKNLSRNLIIIKHHKNFIKRIPARDAALCRTVGGFFFVLLNPPRVLNGKTVSQKFSVFYIHRSTKYTSTSITMATYT